MEKMWLKQKKIWKSLFQKASGINYIFKLFITGENFVLPEDAMEQYVKFALPVIPWEKDHLKQKSLSFNQKSWTGFICLQPIRYDFYLKIKLTILHKYTYILSERNIEAILDKDILTYSSILNGAGMENLSRW